MARFKESRNSFLSGEVSPKTYGRTDLPIYKNACEQLQNVIVYPQGGAGRRPGSRIVDATTFASFTSLRMIPFIISKTQAYNLILTTEVVTVDGSNNILTGVYIVNASTGVIGTILYGFRTGTLTKQTKYTQIASAAHLAEVSFAQQGTTLFLAHADFPPIAIELLATDSFRLLNHWAFFKLGVDPISNVIGTTHAIDVAVSFPYDTRNTAGIDMTVAATTGTGIAISSVGSFSPVFFAGQVGSLIRATDNVGGITGVGVITSIVDGYNAIIDVIIDFGNTNPTFNWAFSMWSTLKGYPRTVAFFEQRLYYGGNIKYPTGIWGSGIGIVNYFRQEHFIQDGISTVVNSDPYSVILSAGDLSEIQWMSPGKTLVIGTLGREVIGEGPDATLALGPLNIGFTPQTAYGSSAVGGVRAQNTVRFVTRSGEKLREINFNILEDAYKAPDLTTYAEHCTRKDINITATLDRTLNTIVELCHQEADNGITWCRTLCNTMFGITRDRDAEDINAFHFHSMGGTFVNAGGDVRSGLILSICVIPSVATLGNHDDLWVAVRRTINGVDKTFIEVIGKEFQGDTMLNASAVMQNKPIYCDSMKFYKGVSTTTGTAAHLPNTEVEVIADGIYLGRMTTNGSGVITLAKAATEIIMGLPYRSVIKTLNLEAGSVVGSAQGTMKKVDEVDLRFYRTIGAKFGPDLNHLQQINFRNPEAPQGDPIVPFSGDKVLKFGAGYNRAAYVYVVQDLPLPFQLTSIIARGITND